MGRVGLESQKGTSMILWYSPREGTIKERITEAAKYFKGKYQWNIAKIHLHPDTLGEETIKVNGIKIVPDEHLQLNHFLVGFKHEN